MTQVSVLEARRDTSGGYKVDVGRGERIGRVSSEWFSRPADKRYLSLSELARAVRDRADHSRTRVRSGERAHPCGGEPQRLGTAGVDPSPNPPRSSLSSRRHHMVASNSPVLI